MTPRATPLDPVELEPERISALPSSNVAAIPPLADHWAELDLRELLSRPAAFLSVAQGNSVYKPGGVQYAEGHAYRGSLGATVRSARAARRAPNFRSFNWVGYTVFRDAYPKSEFDRAQYASWTAGIDATPEQIAWDDALVPELEERVEPGDRRFTETALETAFTGTDLPGALSRDGIEVVVLAGIHLEWCIEGNARAARDHGYLPIVIGDATGAQHPGLERDAFERINRIFGPVISSERFIELVKR